MVSRAVALFYGALSCRPVLSPQLFWQVMVGSSSVLPPQKPDWRPFTLTLGDTGALAALFQSLSLQTLVLFLLAFSASGALGSDTLLQRSKLPTGTPALLAGKPSYLLKICFTLKVAVNTIVPRSPFFAFCTPKYRLL